MIRHLSKCLASAGLAALLVQSASASEPAGKCMPPEQAEALFQLVAPAVFRAVGARCAAQLPGRALKITDPAFLARYDAAKTASQANATRALDFFGAGKLPSSMMPALIDEVGKAIAEDADFKTMGAAQCLSVDHILTAADPLAPSAFARMLIGIVGLSGTDGKSKLPICPPVN